MPQLQSHDPPAPITDGATDQSRSAARRITAGPGPYSVPFQLRVAEASTGAPAGRPALARSVERELLLAAKAGHDRARETLIDSFVPLIANVARLYRGSTSVDRVELMQEGVVGLLRAIDRYDLSLDTPLWAYAAWWVRQAMQQLVAEMTRPVVLSDRAIRQLARLKDARRRHLQAHGAEPTCGQLADETGLARAQVDDLIVAERSPRHLDEPIGGDDGGATTFGDMLADPVAEEAYDGVPQRLAAEELPMLLRRLDDRERLIVTARFGLGGPEQTLREVAGRLHVSAERVRQLEQRALDKLHAAVEGQPPAA